MKKSLGNLLVLFLAECIGTALLLFIGCLGALETSQGPPTQLSGSLAFGLAVMIIINIFGMVSGAHLNPAVTLGAFIYKFMDIPTAIVYVLGQFIGSFLGYGLLRVLFPEADNAICTTQPSIDTAKAFGLEFAITAVLMMVYCGVVDPRNENNQESVSLRFGFTVACISLVAGPFSDASMNPARSFGPALYSGIWNQHWIYWAAPLTSSFVTCSVFRMIFYKAPEKMHKSSSFDFEKIAMNGKSEI